MGPSLSQHAQDPHLVQRRRTQRLRTFSPKQMAVGLSWLSGYDPRTFDAVLDAAEPRPGDEDLHGREPEPVCGQCGSAIGIFLRLGLDWRHYRETRDPGPGDEQGSAMRFGRIELFDPGHAPVVTWRLLDEAASSNP
jgi:hypothetical protein